MVFYNYRKKLEEKEIYKDKMLENLKKLEKLINSELSSKVQNSIIENNELFIKINRKIYLKLCNF